MNSQPPALDINDLLHPANLQDPFALYARLRASGRVHPNPRMQGWTVSHFEDVKAMAIDHRRFSSVSGGPLLRFAESLPPEARANAEFIYPLLFDIIQSSDPPAHTRQRALIAKGFSPGGLERLRPVVEARIDRLISELPPGEPFDFVERFAFPLPALVILDLLGIGHEHHQLVREAAAALAQIPAAFLGRDEGHLRQLATDLRVLDGTLRRMIAERRRAPSKDLLSELAQVRDDGQQLSDDELAKLTSFLLFAGHETTTNLLAGAMWALLPNAVEELLRYVSPVLTVGRLVLEDFELGGVPVGKGQRVSLLIGSANRDPAQFERADEIVLDRPKASSMAFGHGIHFCIGAALARMESQMALRALAQQLPELQVAADEVEYRPVTFLRSMKALPLRFAC